MTQAESGTLLFKPRKNELVLLRSLTYIRARVRIRRSRRASSRSLSNNRIVCKCPCVCVCGYACRSVIGALRRRDLGPRMPDCLLPSCRSCTRGACVSAFPLANYRDLGAARNGTCGDLRRTRYIRPH